MDFIQFFNQNLEQYPAMPLNDLQQRWDIYVRNTDIHKDPKTWMLTHPTVKALFDKDPDKIIPLSREIRTVVYEETGQRLHIDTLMRIVKEIRK